MLGQAVGFHVALSRVTDHPSNAPLLLFADKDGAAHPQEAPRVCSDPKHDPCTTCDSRHQFHSGCSHHRQHDRRNRCSKGWRHPRAMQGNTQNRSLLVLVTLVYLADITLKLVLGHYWRSLLVLSLCGPVLHCQELFISFWSFKDLSFIPKSIPFFHSDLLTPHNVINELRDTHLMDCHWDCSPEVRDAVPGIKRTSLTVTGDWIKLCSGSQIFL